MIHRHQSPSKRRKIISSPCTCEKLGPALNSIRKEMAAMLSSQKQLNAKLSNLMDGKLLEKSPVDFRPAGTELELQELIRNTKVK